MSVLLDGIDQKDLAAIERERLDPTEKFAAHLILSVRNFVIASAVLGSKPIKDWAIKDIIKAAQNGRSHEA